MKSCTIPTNITVRDLADLYGKATLNPSFSITHPDRHLQVPQRFIAELKFPYSRQDGPSPTFSPLCQAQ